ncbi:pentatricopeptide repeat-containing protein [Tripterygium wilfordii]|uniref:Pentatricopeptide repeat-containing protein n=1 Tax=Tripterygium wilfordii TaxID=458696 RepID=A0A7J7C382_TRIWF|nr:pentatricopeptide repeat-containing protein At1g61870, mitochondrial-like [Tripterygium wilfordii]XP_038691672.1 pentatricopeptide repeat-containing protein At1g61870, mitochondrial-like [Tripterygium wilfordii]KAF5728592.1 pentatricopeptide repeat-containing protein [Tripterygium wilfordii]
MAMYARLRVNFLHRRKLSTILAPESSTPISSKKKSRAALSLLKSESNPDRILDICRAASLTPESHLDRVAFSIAVSKLSESNRFDAIRIFLDELKTRPDLKNERFAAHAIALYGQAKMLDHAIRTFKEYQELGSYPPSVKMLNALLFSCVVSKDYKEAKRIFVEFPRLYGVAPNLDTYNAVIKAFCESGSASSVYSVLAEMDMKKLTPNAATFGIILSGFYREEKLEDVGKVLEMMKEKYGIHAGVGTYNVRIRSLCELKKSGEAKALLDGMLSRGMKPNSVTYSHLINGLCGEGDLETAKKLFKELANSGCKPDSRCYFTLVHYLCHGKEYESALNFCKESMEKNWVPNFTTMKSLVNGLASNSMVDEARELVTQMKEKFPKASEMWDEIEAGLPQTSRKD